MSVRSPAVQADDAPIGESRPLAIACLQEHVAEGEPGALGAGVDEGRHAVLADCLRELARAVEVARLGERVVVEGQEVALGDELPDPTEAGEAEEGDPEGEGEVVPVEGRRRGSRGSGPEPGPCL